MNNGTRHKPYPRYKNSGVEWLGDIPEGWPVERMKFHVPIQAGYAFKSEDFQIDGVPVIRMANLKETRLELSDAMRIPRDKTLAEFALKEGDVLMGMSGSIGLTALVRASDLPCQLNQRVGRFRFRTNHLLPEFLRYFVRSQVFKEPIVLNSTGTAQLNVSPDEIGNVWTPIPDMHEQRAIAEFLDRETAKIDELIAKKERLIGLLEEKRAALITHAVTRGLNPDAPLRDSGVEWLGQIPAHWEVVMLKRVAKIRYGLGQPPRESTEGLPMIRATDLHSGKISTDGLMHVDPIDVPWDRNPQLKKNEIIVVRSGAYTGDSAIVPPELAGAISGYDLVLTATKADPQFVACVLLSRYFLESQIDLIRLRAAQPHLNAEELGMCILIQPSIAEQHQIVDHIERANAQMEAVASKVSAAMEKLREYRTAIITAAVTGKIDVRNETKAAA